jgi:hypothetical protein
MSRFIAIPVAQGDAFYLERGEWSVLVDGGRGRAGFAAMFQTATKTDGVSLAVCTHNDADHANGILGFLEAGFRCEEVWLPGRWLAALPDVLKPFVEVFVELAADVAQVKGLPDTEKQQSGLSPIEAYGEDLPPHLDEAPMSDRKWYPGFGCGLPRIGHFFRTAIISGWIRPECNSYGQPSMRPVGFAPSP